MRWAERLLLTGVALDFVHLMILFDRRREVDGMALALAFTVGVPILTAVLALFVTRRQSIAAFITLCLLIGLALVTAANIGPATWVSTAHGLFGGLSLLAYLSGIALAGLALFQTSSRRNSR